MDYLQKLYNCAYFIRREESAVKFAPYISLSHIFSYLLELLDNLFHYCQGKTTKDQRFMSICPKNPIRNSAETYLLGFVLTYYDAILYRKQVNSFKCIVMKLNASWHIILSNANQNLGNAQLTSNIMCPIRFKYYIKLVTPICFHTLKLICTL